MHPSQFPRFTGGRFLWEGFCNWGITALGRQLNGAGGGEPVGDPLSDRGGGYGQFGYFTGVNGEYVAW